MKPALDTSLRASRCSCTAHVARRLAVLGWSTVARLWTTVTVMALMPSIPDVAPVPRSERPAGARPNRPRGLLSLTMSEEEARDARRARRARREIRRRSVGRRTASLILDPEQIIEGYPFVAPPGTARSSVSEPPDAEAIAYCTDNARTLVGTDPAAEVAAVFILFLGSRGMHSRAMRAG